MSINEIEILKRALNREREAKEIAEKFVEQRIFNLYSENVSLNKKFKSQSEFQRILIDNLVDALFVIDFKGNILQSNKEARKLIGLKSFENFPNSISEFSNNNYKSLLHKFKNLNLKILKEKSTELKIDDEMLARPLNVGFSGGEKKRNEILQMALLEPSFIIMDETDSGLDIDALKVVSNGVNSLRDPDRSFLIITHYQRLLNYIKPDFVHVLSDGKIVKTGDWKLALDLEKEGYGQFIN